MGKEEAGIGCQLSVASFHDASSGRRKNHQMEKLRPHPAHHLRLLRPPGVISDTQSRSCLSWRLYITNRIAIRLGIYHYLMN